MSIDMQQLNVDLGLQFVKATLAEAEEARAGDLIEGAALGRYLSWLAGRLSGYALCTPYPDVISAARKAEATIESYRNLELMKETPHA